MAFVHLEELFISVSDFEDKGEMVVVSEVSGFNMNPIQVVVVTDFFPPGLSDLGIFPLVASMMMLMGVVMDSGKVFQHKLVNDNFFVTH